MPKHIHWRVNIAGGMKPRATCEFNFIDAEQQLRFIEAMKQYLRAEGEEDGIAGKAN